VHVLPTVLSLNMIGIASGEYFCSCSRCIVLRELIAPVCKAPSGKEVSGEQRGAEPRLNRECKSTRLLAKPTIHSLKPTLQVAHRALRPTCICHDNSSCSLISASQRVTPRHTSPTSSLYAPSIFSLLDTPVTNQIKYCLIRNRAITTNTPKNREALLRGEHGSTMCLWGRLLEGSPLQA
jgi:hypothetical protein